MCQQPLIFYAVYSKGWEVQELFTKLVWLTGLLSPGWSDLCVWEKTFPSYRRGVGWVEEMAEEQGYGRTVINELQEGSRSSGNTWRSAAMEPLLHKNWYQMTQAYKSDTDHTTDMWLLLQNKIQHMMWACASFTQAVERQTIRMNNLKDSVEQSTTIYSKRDLLPRLYRSKMVNKLKPVTLGYTRSVLCITGSRRFPFSSWKLLESQMSCVTTSSECHTMCRRRRACSAVPWCRGHALAARKRKKGG